MKKEAKDRRAPEPEMLDEYDFSGAVRGKYASAYARGTNLVLLDEDVARLFPTAESVNQALRALARIARRQTGKASG